MLSLIPAGNDGSFVAIELGVGGGWLSEAVLDRFPNATVIGLDGSPAMLRATESALQRFQGRFQVRPFRLHDSSWLDDLAEMPRCFLSSLVIHHLDGASKARLYRELYRCLELGGALLIADLVAPNSERERRYLACAYDDETRRRSLAITGSLDLYRDLMEREWNWFEHPDPIDMPSTIAEHLRWLDEAGFAGVGAFWLKAGHAVYGGYKQVD